MPGLPSGRDLPYHPPVRKSAFAVAIALALVTGLAGARPEARPTADRPDAARIEAALRELLDSEHGPEAWNGAPSLVLLTSIMNYAEGTIASGFRATSEQLNDQDLSDLASDLKQALRDLSDGALDGFRTVTRDRVLPARVGTIVRSGRIVVGRFRGLARVTHNLGYGGRRSKNGVINGGFVLLDADADRDARQRNLLRTHELGHALGYHHVESEPSIMNSRIGSPLTPFDRAMFHLAFFRTPGN